jgi:hypothetical protein
MMKSVCAASILAIAAGASAAPFTALSYEAGGGLPGIAGPGISVSSGGFFTADGAGNNVFGATSASMTAGNEYEFDSHFALDGFGPSARNRTLAPANNSAATLAFYGDYGVAGVAANNYDELEGTAQNGFGPFNAIGAAYVSGPGSHVGDPAFDASNPVNEARAGIAASPPPVSSHFAPMAGGGRSAFDGVFVGRFTVSRGATLSGGMLFNTVDPNSPTGFSGATLMLGGPGVAIGTINGAQVLGLRSYLVTQVDLINPSASAGDGASPYGLSDVYDLWVQVIPTPGTLAIAGLAGIVAIRRRRA